MSYIAGEALPPKVPVCIGESDGYIYQAQATTWTRMPCFGVCLVGKELGATILETEIAQFGRVDNINRDLNFSYDDSIFVSANLGKVTTSPGPLVQSIGRALNSSDIILQIDATVIE